jgi:phosphoglucosamine mutase
VGATHPELLRQTVLERRADLGIALDGDADRLQIVDHTGRLFNGDELLYLMADDRLSQGESVPGVVGTLMTNLAIEVALRQRGVDVERAAVGDRYVLEALARRNWLLGGESSGHLLVLDKHSTGDGLVSALQVLQACVRRGQRPAELLQGIDLYPQTLVNVRLQPGQDWKRHAPLQDAIRAVEQELGQRGRVLIRASGTEPLVRVMVEADDARLADDCAHRLAEQVRLVPSS